MGFRSVLLLCGLLKSMQTIKKHRLNLSQKIVKGGSGVWGDVAMAAHPDLQQKDLNQIIQYILSLKPKKAQGPKRKA